MSNKSSRFSGGGNRDDEDDDEKSRPSSGSRPSSPFNRSSASGKSDDKSSSNRSPFGSRRNDDDDDDQDEEDEKPARPSSPFGGSRPASSSSFGSSSNKFGSRSNANDDDDEDDDQDEEDEKPARPSSPFGGSRPASSSSFGSGNKPAPSSPFGSKPAEPAKPASSIFGSGNKPADPPKSGTFGRPNEPAKPPASSPFGGSKAAEPAKPGSSIFGSGNKPADPPKSGTFGKPNEPAKPATSSPFGGSKAAEPAKPGGSSPFGGSNKPNDPPKSGTFGKPNEPAKPASSPFGSSKPADPPKPGGSSPFGGSAKPADASKSGTFGKPNEPAKPATSSPFGGSKAAEPAKSGGSSPFGGGTKPTTSSKPGAKADDKDEKPASGGGLFGRFGKKDDKPEEKPSSSAASKPSTSTPAKPASSPFGSSKPAEPAKPAGSGSFGSSAAKPAPSSPFGGSKPAEPAKPGAGSSPFGGSKPATPATASKPGAKPDDKKDEKPAGGGLFGRFGKKDDKPEEKPATTSKPSSAPPLSKPNVPAASTAARPGVTGTTSAGAVAKTTGAASAVATAKDAPKVPPGRQENKTARPLEKGTKVTVKSEGLSLDQKLDIVGYIMMGAAVLTFFGFVQPSDGFFTAYVAKILGDSFGAAKYLWPAILMGVGLWLLIRRFQSDPFLVINLQRALGSALLYLSIVTTFQWVAILPVHLPPGNLAKVAAASDHIASLQQGGGKIGSLLYQALVAITGTGSLSDYSIPIILFGLLMISMHLAFNISTADIALRVRSVFIWFSRVFRSYSETSRAARQARAELAAQKAAEKAKLAPPAPTPALAPATAAAGALTAPAPRTAIPEKTGSAPVASPTPVAGPPKLTPATPIKASPFGKPADTAVKTDEEAEEEVKEVTPVKASPLGTTSTPANKPGLFGAKPANNPFKPAEPVKEADDKPAEPVKDTKDTPPAPEAAKPANRPNPFGAKPADDKPAEAVKDEPAKASGDTPAPVPEAAKPANRFNPFGAKPAGTPAKPADDKPAEAVKDEPAKASGDTPAPAPEAAKPANRFNPFGAKPASTPAGTPAKPADDKAVEAVKDEPAKASGDTPAPASEAAKPANRFNPFGAKPAGTPAKPADPIPTDVPKESVVAKPAESALADEKPTEDLKPATPIGNRPNPFGAKPNPFAAKPADDPKPAAASQVKDQEDDEAPTPDIPLKPATPIGNRPNPFAAKPADNLPPSTSPTDAKPATPIGNRPNPFGAPRPNFSSPVPKPGVSAQPEKVQDAEKDDEPKYVDVDEVDNAERPLNSGGTSAGPARPPVTSSFAPKPPATLPTSTPPTAASGGTARPNPFGARPNPFGGGAKPESNPGPENKVEAKVETKVAEPPAVDSADEDSAPEPAKPVLTGDKPAAPSAEALQDVSKVAIHHEAEPPKSDEGAIFRSKASQFAVPNVGDLLEVGSAQNIDDAMLKERAAVIEDTLKAFGAPGKIVEINSGPVITQFGVEPDYLVSRQGKKTRVKVSSIAKLDADLALALAARSIRIEAPVPGKGYVGIEVPNAQTAMVSLRDIMESEEFGKIKSKLRIGLGQSVDGAPIAADLTQMPHLLIAGTTGSGKSVCVNAIIACLLLENSPDDLKMIMVDPKRVELTGYNGIPHLVSPVVVDLERIVGVLKWVTREMDERYKKFAQAGARNIIDFNNRIGPSDPKLPYLVVVIDELADLMMLAPEETEKVLTRLAQMARATGIHLIVSTQRPSVDVVTGLIKANFPARISFAVASSVDSRVILDAPGAEKLLGRGDMLYQSPDAAAPLRMQGVFVSDAEINRITKYWKSAGPASPSVSSLSTPVDLSEKPDPVQSRSEKFGSSPARPGANPGAGRAAWDTLPMQATKAVPLGPRTSDAPNSVSMNNSASLGGAEEDDMYDAAVDLVKRTNNKASISLLQRRLKVGYTRAARLIDLMKQRGVIDATANTDQPDDDEAN